MSDVVNDIILQLKTQKKKITTIRRAIIQMVCSSHTVLSAVDIQKKLSERKIDINKTTVYRELACLLKHDIIKEVHLKSGITHYESAYHSHHHHLSCLNCGRVEDIDTNSLEKDMKTLEKQAKQKGFTVKRHTVELYGLCPRCT
jgi:Fur family transcriptional regulator, ferric uptake regulator